MPDEITGLAFYDGSSLAQLSARYFLSSRWTVGRRDSERGSAPQPFTTTSRLVRYF